MKTFLFLSLLMVANAARLDYGKLIQDENVGQDDRLDNFDYYDFGDDNLSNDFSDLFDDEYSLDELFADSEDQFGFDEDDFGYKLEEDSGFEDDDFGYKLEEDSGFDEDYFGYKSEEDSNDFGYKSEEDSDDFGYKSEEDSDDFGYKLDDFSEEEIASLLENIFDDLDADSFDFDYFGEDNSDNTEDDNSEEVYTDYIEDDNSEEVYTDYIENDNLEEPISDITEDDNSEEAISDNSEYDNSEEAPKTLEKPVAKQVAKTNKLAPTKKPNLVLNKKTVDLINKHIKGTKYVALYNIIHTCQLDSRMVAGAAIRLLHEKVTHLSLPIINQAWDKSYESLSLLKPLARFFIYPQSREKLFHALEMCHIEQKIKEGKIRLLGNFRFSSKMPWFGN